MNINSYQRFRRCPFGFRNVAPGVSHETGVQPSLAVAEDYISIRLPQDQCWQRETAHRPVYGRVPPFLQMAFSLELKLRFYCATESSSARQQRENIWASVCEQ